MYKEQFGKHRWCIPVICTYGHFIPMVILYPWLFHNHSHFISMVVLYPQSFCTHLSCFIPMPGHFISTVVLYPVISYPNSVNLYSVWASLYPNGWFIPTCPNIHSFKIPHTQAHEHMLIVVYDKLVEPSNQDPSKILLCILATLLTQDKCDIFNEPVYCLHFWLSWQWKLVEVWYFFPLSY